MPIDIIIPILNEEKILTAQETYYRNLGRKANLVFVDGGSCDRSVEFAGRCGTVLKSAPGRSRQKNLGAARSAADILLFLHADSVIEIGALGSIEKSLGSGGTAGGCFTMTIGAEGMVFRVYEHLVNWRAKRFGVTDGDLGLFVKRALFEDVGGFDEVAIMEDLMLGKKLRAAGKIVALTDNIRVSARRWQEQGFLKTFFLYTLAYVQLWTGLPFFKEKKIAPQT